MKFRKAFSRERRYAPTGEKFTMEHEANIDLNGRRYLTKTKRVESYELIQSYAEECNIQNIIRRATNGDPSLLQQVIGTYQDITEVPKTVAEAQQLIINLKEAFSKLPKETRAKFEFNDEIYVAQFGSEQWADKMGLAEVIKEAEARRAEKTTFEQEQIQAVKNLAKMNAFETKKEEISNE